MSLGYSRRVQLGGDVRRFARKENKTFVNFSVDGNMSSWVHSLIMFDQAAGFRANFPAMGD